MKSKIRRSRIASVVAQKTQQAGSSKPALAREIAAYLMAERRTGDLNSIMRDVQSDWADNGFVEIIATSAHPLTEELKTEIMLLVQPLYPKAKTFAITQEHDADVIGGVKVSVANQQLDLTLESKLDRFKQLTTAGKE